MSKEIDFRKMMSRAPRVRLGDYIEQTDERNSTGIYTSQDVRGISNLKTIIPTKANLDGVSLNSYKILNHNEFCYVTVTSRNGERISLALNEDNNPYIFSNTYITFKSIDIDKLDPKFLYIILSRLEFDRYSRFNSWGSARETFDWTEMQRVIIPLPSIEVQREIVAIYEGLKKIAEENEALLEPLQESCHAYVVDCKSKYPAIHLEQIIDEYNDLNIDNSIKTVKSVSVYKEFRDTNAKVNKEELSRYKIVLPGQLSYVQTTKNEKCFACAVNNSDQPIVVTSVNKVIGSKNERVLSIEYLFLFFNRPEFDRYAIFNSWGSAREVFQYDDLKQVMIPLPPIEVQKAIVSIYHCMEEAKNIAREARELMKTICPALIQKAANSI